MINEVKISYKPVQKIHNDAIMSPEDVVPFLWSIWNEERGIKESMYAIMLDSRLHITNYSFVSMGTSRASIVEPKDVIRPALLTLCDSLIIAHNHPSGNMEFSKSDINLTKRIKEACELFSFSLHDHIVIAGNGDNWMSGRQEGIL